MTRQEPGIVLALEDATYRALPGLSGSAMKHLLRSPKHYRHEMDTRTDKPEFDFGHAVHSLVLGTGAPMVAIPDDVLASNGAASTVAAKEWIAAERAAGHIPLKADVIAAVVRCADAVRANAKARHLLDLPGNSEVSITATEPKTGVLLKGRLDRLATLPDGHVVNIDLKTTTDVRDLHLRREIEDKGYDVQASAYELLIALASELPPSCVAPSILIFVEKDEPHEVRVVSLAHPDWKTVGAYKRDQAIRIYAECVASGIWPGADDEPGTPDALEPRPYYFENAIDPEEMVMPDGPQ